MYHPVVWAKDATGKYVITDLGTFGGNSGKAFGINSQGEIVGIAQAADTRIYAFLIRPLTVNGSKVWYQDLNLDGINDLMTNLGVAVDDSDKKAISDNTQIAAGVNLVQFDGAGNEVVTTLPRTAAAVAINDNRQVAGVVDDAVAPMQPAIWQVDAAGNALSMITLSPLPGNTYGEAVCINALGQAAGDSSPSREPGVSASHAVAERCNPHRPGLPGDSIHQRGVGHQHRERCPPGRRGGEHPQPWGTRLSSGRTA